MKLDLNCPKPSMYTGALKRVVQACYGLGIIDQENDGTFNVVNFYNYQWEQSHGILKVKDFLDNTWVYLIEISEKNGVLACLLPTILGTEDAEYRSALDVMGDSDSLNIIDEFGAMPTGETFPVGDDLEDAISAGDVLQLLAPAKIKPFYTDPTSKIDKQALYFGCGWAFSDKGTTLEAHNTTFWYSDQDTALARGAVFDPGVNPQPPYPPNFAEYEDRFLRAEHWKVKFKIVPPGNGENGIGTGSAELTMVESGFMVEVSNRHLVFSDSFGVKGTTFMRVPLGDISETLIPFRFLGWEEGPDPGLARHDRMDAEDTAIYVFYVGETLEVVRHQRERFVNRRVVRGPSQVYVDYGFSGGVGFELSAEYNHPPGANLDHFWRVVSDGITIFRSWNLDDSLTSYPAPGGPSAPGSGSTASGPAILSSGGHNLPILVEYQVDYGLADKSTGRFHSTSLDLRETRDFGWAIAAKQLPPAEILHNAENWTGEIGLIIPVMCREGFIFAKMSGGQRLEIPGRDGAEYSSVAIHSTIEQFVFIPGLSKDPFKLPTLENIPMNTVDPFDHDFGPPGIPTGENANASAEIQWQLTWLNLLNPNFDFGSSINAGPTKCGIISDGVFIRDFQIVDQRRPTYRAVIEGVKVDKIPKDVGIPVKDIPAIDATFVGAV